MGIKLLPTVKNFIRCSEFYDDVVKNRGGIRQLFDNIFISIYTLYAANLLINNVFKVVIHHAAQLICAFKIVAHYPLV